MPINLMMELLILYQSRVFPLTLLSLLISAQFPTISSSLLLIELIIIFGIYFILLNLWLHKQVSFKIFSENNELIGTIKENSKILEIKSILKAKN